VQETATLNCADAGDPETGDLQKSRYARRTNWRNSRHKLLFHPGVLSLRLKILNDIDLKAFPTKMRQWTAKAVRL